tara:strand:- start:12547 stop:13080 length:534 start_codon:yes stop_codon:yes gene_type:complete
MDLKKFKSKKIVATIGALFPLIILFGFVISQGGWDLNLNNPSSIISLILLISVSVYYIMILLQIIIEGNINILPFNTKMVYSQYGTFFLTKVKEKNNELYNCRLYVNKYWLFLTLVNKEKIIFKGNTTNLDTKIDNELNRYTQLSRNNNELGELFKKWDGITDEVTRREKEIDKVIK